VKGKFNILQKTMLQWNEVHPYNAFHAVRIQHQLDRVRLSAVIDTLLEHYGLTGLTLDKSKGTYQYLGGPVHTEIRIIEADDHTHEALRHEVETQINSPFADDGVVNPFRFFVIPERGSFYLGMTYFHCIAGAESIVFLMKGIVNMYLQRKPEGFRRQLNLYPKKKSIYPSSLIRTLTTLPSHVRDMRKAFRPGYRTPHDRHNGFSFFSLGPDEFTALVRTAKSWSVTLNDIFLALLMKSLSPLASGRFRAGRRRHIAVGSIVNIRKDLGIDSRDTFGLFLGSFIVSHDVPKGISLEELAKDVHRQTETIKRYKLYLRTPIELFFAQILLSLLSPYRQKMFFQKYYPLWGGITNMNMNLLWKQDESEKPIDYFRAVSTGPVTPLVLSITTAGDRVNVGLTYNTAVFTEQDVAVITADLFQPIPQLVEVS
jgi:hypothetical protein